MKKNPATKTSLLRNTSYIGERIEKKIQRITNNNEPIHDGAPLIYTERKEGVQPEYNIRTDRWEVAVDAMDKVDKANKAKRADRIEESKKNMEIEKKTEKTNNGGAEPTQATDNK